MTISRLLVALIMLAVPPLATAGEAKEVTGFQKVKFGFTFDQVKEVFPDISGPDFSEGDKAAGTASNLRIVGRPAAISFRFHQGKFYEAVVAIMIDRSADDAHDRVLQNRDTPGEGLWSILQ